MFDKIDYKDFGKEFLQAYLARGMGSLSKRELDTLVMHLMEKFGDLEFKSNHELSIQLRLSESRVKGLRYEGRLKYPPDEDRFVERRFLYALTRAQFDADQGWIIFSLEDSYLRHAIRGQLKQSGALTDTSFNTELVKVRLEHLEPILISFFGAEISKSFAQDMKKALAKDSKITFAAIRKKFVLGAASGLGGTTVKMVKSLLYGDPT